MVTCNARSLSLQRSTRASTQSPYVQVEDEVSARRTCTQGRPSRYMLVSKMRWSTCGVCSLDCPEREALGLFCTWPTGRSISMADGICIRAARRKVYARRGAAIVARRRGGNLSTDIPKVLCLARRASHGYCVLVKLVRCQTARTNFPGLPDRARARGGLRSAGVVWWYWQTCLPLLLLALFEAAVYHARTLMPRAIRPFQ